MSINLRTATYEEGQIKDQLTDLLALNGVTKNVAAIIRGVTDLLEKQTTKIDGYFMPRLNNRLYSPAIIHDLIKQADEEIAMIRQWAGYDDSVPDYQRAAHYESRLSMLVELMESVAVFSLGDGANGFRKSFDTGYIDVKFGLYSRLESFKIAFKFNEIHNPPKPQPEAKTAKSQKRSKTTTKKAVVKQVKQKTKTTSKL